MCLTVNIYFSNTKHKIGIYIALVLKSLFEHIIYIMLMLAYKHTAHLYLFDKYILRVYISLYIILCKGFHYNFSTINSFQLFKMMFCSVCQQNIQSCFSCSMSMWNEVSYLFKQSWEYNRITSFVFEFLFLELFHVYRINPWNVHCAELIWNWKILSLIDFVTPEWFFWTNDTMHGMFSYDTCRMYFHKESFQLYLQ